MKAALLQLNSGDDPAANLLVTADAIRKAADNGAGFILTPEVTNCVSTSRAHQETVLQPEARDQTLAGLRALVSDLKVWILIGSLALKTDDEDGRFANRSFLIDPMGDIRAWYDKIHMFDVQISETESYKESAGYRSGHRAVASDTPFGTVGMTICYDVRFPHLYRDLAQAGVQILTVPSAFSPVSGAAHWETLLRARAIETGCYVLAPAQCGTHAAQTGKSRKTYGYTMAVSPWGEILCQAKEMPTIEYVDLNMSNVAKARQRIPALRHDRSYDGP